MKNLMMLMSVLAAATLLTSVGGCATSAPTGSSANARASSPARVHHPVFFTLHDAQDRDALIADCDALLSVIPGVVAYACGVHYESGRSTVESGYDVGLYIAFDNEDSYAAYVTHPNHVQLVEQWMPRLASLRVYDILTPR